MTGAIGCGATSIAVGLSTDAGEPSDAASIWRSTIRAAFRSGMPADGATDSDASAASRNKPDF